MMFFLGLLKFIECVLFSSILIIIGSILMNPDSLRHFLGLVKEDENLEKLKPTTTLLSRLGLFIIIIAIVYIIECIFGLGFITKNNIRL